MRINKGFAFIALALIALLLPGMSGCASDQEKTVQGIIQEIDQSGGSLSIMAGGEIIKTGISKNTQVHILGKYLDTSYLEAGLQVIAQIKGQSAGLIEVTLAQVQASILKVGDNQITIQPASSSQEIVLKTKPFSSIKQNDAEVGLNSLKPGALATVDFCTASGTAYQINQMPEGYAIEKAPEGSRLEGVVTKYRFGELTLTPIGGVDRKAMVGEGTIITFEDKSPATPDDILYWDYLTVYCNPSTGITTRIEIQPVSSLRTNTSR